MFDLEYFKKFNDKNKFFITGCDEVGRGPLAGPVVAASASLHIENYKKIEVLKILNQWAELGVTDSKTVNEKKRQFILSAFSGLSNYLENELTLSNDQKYIFEYSKNISLNISIKQISPQIIDEINILNASLLAMKESALKSSDILLPGVVLIDGNRKFKWDHPAVFLEAVVKGDSKSLLIGLASIVAKEFRDQLMKNLAEDFPGYGWEKNAGYPTAMHLEAITKLGITDIHRKTFKGVKEFNEKGI